MKYETFQELIKEVGTPIILIEGIRALPSEDRDRLTGFSNSLAKEYPHALFRTGNATGSDEAFAAGVAQVDSSRLQYVLPYSKHRQKQIDEHAIKIAVTEISSAEEDLAVSQTCISSPQHTTMMEKRHKIPQLKAKSLYILRDTIKVIGALESKISPTTVGIFYVNKDDPMKGGTGHTIRVCQSRNIPVFFQDEWMNWPLAV